MPKNTVAEWDTTAGNNTDVGGINIAEGMSPGNVNNAMREMMAQVAAWRSLVGQLGDSETVTGTWTFNTMPVIPDGGVAFAKIAPSAVITEAEGIQANDNDTSLPTSAAVKDYADALLLNQNIASGTAVVSLTIPARFTALQIRLEQIVISVATDETVRMQFGTGGAGGSFVSTNYDESASAIVGSSAAVNSANASGSLIVGDTASVAGNSAALVTVGGLNTASGLPFAFSQSRFTKTAGPQRLRAYREGLLFTPGNYNAVRFFPSTGTFTSGRIVVRGLP